MEFSIGKPFCYTLSNSFYVMVEKLKVDTIWKYIVRRWLFLLSVLLVLVLSSAVSFAMVQYWDWLRTGHSTGGIGTETGSTTIRNLGLVVVALIALPLATWRSATAHRQAVSAQLQTETAQRSLLNERYQTGTEMLGSPALTVRLGGIYSLNRLAREHADSYHIQIAQLFVSFIQNPPRQEETDGSAEGEQQYDVNILREKPRLGRRTDIRAILKCLGKRTVEQRRIGNLERFNLAISKANLSGAILPDADLSNLSCFEVNLSDALLAGADLSNSNLWYVDLEHANLEGATLANANLRRANLRNTNLSGANLSGAQFGPISGEDSFEPSEGLTQAQLDEAVADVDNPPIITGMSDCDTGLPLVWRSGVPSKS